MNVVEWSFANPWAIARPLFDADRLKLIASRSSQFRSFRGISLDTGDAPPASSRTKPTPKGLPPALTVESETKIAQSKPYIAPPRPGGESFIGIQEKLAGGIALNMVLVPGGAFSVTVPPAAEEGDGQRYQIQVPAFYLGKFQVTQKQWHAVSLLEPVNRELRSHPSRFAGDNLPVERVSWYEAVEFCDRLSRLTERDYRLPSEAEWEYACRAGTTTPYAFGESLKPEHANFGHRQRIIAPGILGIGRKTEAIGTEPVGSYPANAFGLHEMHGNVWEWCQDVWRGLHHPVPADGSAWTEWPNQEGRVCRGGSWSFSLQHCRSDYREFYSPGNRLNYIGFRVACTVH